MGGGKDGHGKDGGYGRGQDVERGIMDLGWGGRALRGGEGVSVLGGADGGTLEFPRPWAIVIA